VHSEITHENISQHLCPRQENGSVGRVGFIDDTVSPKGNKECISGPVSGATSTDEDAISWSFRIQSLLLRVPTRCREERKTFHLQVRVRECAFHSRRCWLKPLGVGVGVGIMRGERKMFYFLLESDLCGIVWKGNKGPFICVQTDDDPSRNTN